MSMWKSVKEEIAQRIENLSLHAVEAYAVTVTAALIGAGWQEATIGVIFFSVAWEVGGHYVTADSRLMRFLGFTGKPWQASFLGMATFWIGAIAGGIVVMAAT